MSRAVPWTRSSRGEPNNRGLRSSRMAGRLGKMPGMRFGTRNVVRGESGHGGGEVERLEEEAGISVGRGDRRHSGHREEAAGKVILRLVVGRSTQQSTHNRGQNEQHRYGEAMARRSARRHPARLDNLDDKSDWNRVGAGGQRGALAETASRQGEQPSFFEALSPLKVHKKFEQQTFAEGRQQGCRGTTSSETRGRSTSTERGGHLWTFKQKTVR